MSNGTLKERFDALVEKIKKHNPAIELVEIQYSGSGDSGWCEGAISQPQQQEISNKTIGNEAEELAMDILEKYHSGWEINDGSQGMVTIDVKAGRIHLEHNAFYTESECYEYGNEDIFK